MYKTSFPNVMSGLRTGSQLATASINQLIIRNSPIRYNQEKSIDFLSAFVPNSYLAEKLSIDSTYTILS